MTLHQQVIFNGVLGLAAAPLFVFTGALGASDWVEPVAVFGASTVAGIICPGERWAVHPLACLAGGVMFLLSIICLAPIHFYHGLAALGFGGGLSVGGLVRARIRSAKEQRDA